MRNPFRSEAEAYRFLLLTIGYFALIAIASYAGGRWAGVAVFVVVTVAAAVWLFRGEQPERVPPAPPVRRGGDNERRILVIANETVGAETLRECIRERAEGTDERILVVSPALNSPLRHWASDEDRARAAAHQRLNESVRQLEEAGLSVFGQVGDGEPLQAIEDAVRTFGPDEIIISTHPEGRSHWLERGVVEAARARFAIPITHLVVDLAAERQEVR